MRYFVSAGEPSGDLHGANLLRRIRERDPSAECFGFGGRLMQAAGCRLLYPLAEHPVIGVAAAIRAIPAMLRRLNEAKDSWRRQRPDVVVIIDYPGFHWHVARAAKALGIPVVYFVPPQVWAWATWRVAKVRRFIDHVLCTLPFEEAWYEQRGVRNASFVGHPFFDDLEDRTIDDGFVESMRNRGRFLALLPGSRGWEVRSNTRTLLETARVLAVKQPDLRFAVAAFRPQHAEYVQTQAAKLSLPIEIHVGRTPEILASADAAVSVSGSVSLELLYYGVPAAIVYRVSPFLQYVLRPLLVRTPYVTLVNLMAGRTLYPEFVGCGEPSASVARTVDEWLSDERKRQDVKQKLAKLKKLYAKPGATAAAADRIVEVALGRQALRRAS
jgi:lipid-A-disaccharide synthase